MGFLDNVMGAFRGAVSTRSTARDQTAEGERQEDREELQEARQETPEVVRQGAHETREQRFESYTVKVGDSLGEIGARFGVSSEEIATLNIIENPDLIFPGQVFRIPTS